MTDESAAVVERYDYDAYGEPRVYAGVSGSAESGSLRMASAIGNPYLHQGLRRDNETGLHENRYRMLHSRLGRFMQKDPLELPGSAYEYLNSNPGIFCDVLGLAPGDPGHHYVPQSVRDSSEIAGKLDQGAYAVLKHTTTGVTTEPPHGNTSYGGVQHGVYNDEVKKALLEFIKEKGKEKHGKLTSEEALEFINKKIIGADPKSLIGRFLAGVAAHEAKYAVKAVKWIGGKRIIQIVNGLKVVNGALILFTLVTFVDSASANGIGYAIIENAVPIPLETIKEGQAALIKAGQAMIDNAIAEAAWKDKSTKRNCGNGLEDIGRIIKHNTGDLK
ncbi:MAG: RHS repeat-associated core domain-containing protein [Phycisphaerales bacterium]|nr:RHS repeat-associated core domain-containing protein [Phycisphaerales bacterium]